MGAKDEAEKLGDKRENSGPRKSSLGHLLAGREAWSHEQGNTFQFKMGTVKKLAASLLQSHLRQ